MGLDPQKFFIGLIDFFSILMPGAMLAYLCKDGAAAWFGAPLPYRLDGSEAGGVFLFASYLLGHFAFLISSLLDEWVYDRARSCTDWQQASKRLAAGKRLSPGWARWLARDGLFGRDADNALQQVLRIKARTLNALGADRAINSFQWSKVRLAKELPAGLVTVQRFEADSKFFRSFTVVLAVLAGYFAAREHGAVAAWWCLAGIAPALWRYVDQRFKATQQAYWFVISLESGATTAPLRIAREDGLTHAGGVVYRHNKGVTEFLLVQTSKSRSVWVLPKGHIEAGEDPRLTAVREVREETGQWGRITHWLGDGALGSGAGEVRVRWFLLEAEDEIRRLPAECRQSAWFAVEEALERARFPETRALLGEASRRVEALRA